MESEKEVEEQGLPKISVSETNADSGEDNGGDATVTSDKDEASEPETEAGESQTTEEAGEATEGEDSGEGEEPKPKVKGRTDVERQAWQQELANTRKAMKAEMDSAIGQIRELLVKQASQPATTPAKVESAEAAKAAVDDLDEMMANLGDDDFADGKFLKKLIATVKSDRSKKTEYEKKIEALNEQLSSMQSTAQAEQEWREWDREHPNAAPKRKELMGKAIEAAQRRYPNASSESLVPLVDFIFDQLVTEAEASASKVTPKPPSVPAKTAAKSGNPPASVKGAAEIIKPAAGSGRSAPRPQDDGFDDESEIPVMWKSDE